MLMKDKLKSKQKFVPTPCCTDGGGLCFVKQSPCVAVDASGRIEKSEAYQPANNLLHTSNAACLSTNEFRNGKPCQLLFQKLLSDSSASVRHAAVSNLEEFCQNLSPDVQEVMITQRILPFLNRVVKDTNFYVRLAATSALAGLAPIVGKRK